MSEQPREWIFTFGGGHVHPTTGESLSRRYVRITGTRREARARMVAVFGVKWSHQYPTTDDAGVEQFELEELPPAHWPALPLPLARAAGLEGMLEAMAKLLRGEGYAVLSPSERADEVSHARDFWGEVDRLLLLPKLRAELTRRRADRGAAPEHGTHDYAVAGELDELLAWLESDEVKP
jgi:hypothetical protein